MKILVSACLLSQPTRYDGGACPLESDLLHQWTRRGLVIAVCPEVAGGLPVPRPPAEIRGAGGQAVLDGTGRVTTLAGEDVTQAFLQGASRTLDVARANGVRLTVLKEDSPSCGRHTVYDGSFTGRLIAGQGVTAALLEHNGVSVFSEHELGRAAELLADLERGEKL